MSKQAYKRVRRALNLEVSRKPLDSFTSLGCYPIYYVFSDGGCICPKCVNENIDQIDGAMRDRDGNRPHSSGCGGWAIDAADVNYEDASLICDNCGERIESAYAEDDAAPAV